MLKVLLIGFSFLYCCTAFAIDEIREYKVANRSQYFYFSGDTLFLEILAIDKPVRYSVDTFFRTQEGNGNFYNAREFIRFEDVGFYEFRLVIKGPESHGRGSVYFAKPVSRKEKTTWNRLYNSALMDQYYNKVARLKKSTDPLNVKKKTWDSIHKALQELNRIGEQYNRQEFEMRVIAIFKENGCMACFSSSE